MKQQKEISAGTLKPYILVTLSHVEKREKMEPKKIAEIFKRLFRCKSIVIAKETHKELGQHLHIAIYNDSASRYNAVKRIRQAFPQFEGRQCNVTFHKGLNYMLAYVTKEDKDPYVEGEIDKKSVLEIAENARKKKRAGRRPAKEVLKALRECEKWEDVYENDELIDRIVYGSHRNFKTIYQELQIIKESKTHATTRMRRYLDERKVDIRRVKEYTPEELKEKYVLLDWIAVNILYRRPMKTKQLLLYGEPSTQKTLLIQMLRKALRIYFVGTRMNDFAGADDYYDMWVFDEYTSNEKRGIHGDVEYSEAASTYNRTILRILDGQECRLDAKYGEILRKTNNIPIILIANEIPQQCRHYGPLQERLMRLRFYTRIENIDEERIVKTLMGCIHRRINQKMQSMEELRKLLLLYNQETAKATEIKLMDDKLHKIRTQKKCEKERLFRIKTEQGKYLILKVDNEEKTATLLVDPESYEEHIMSTIKYALIPLKNEEQTQIKIKKIEALNRGAQFNLCRERDEQGKNHYLTWPVNLHFLNKNKILSAEVRVETLMQEIQERDYKEKEEKIIIRIGAENQENSKCNTGETLWMHHD